jgi:hypothetical protein
MDINNMHKQNKNYTDKSTVYIKIYHQNIRGLGMKSIELIDHLHPDYPHALYITEHHSKLFQIKNILMEIYNLGTSYCREQYEKRGVAICIHKSIQCSITDIVKYCKENI